jgi:hypothetical protein
VKLETRDSVNFVWFETSYIQPCVSDPRVLPSQVPAAGIWENEMKTFSFLTLGFGTGFGFSLSVCVTVSH